MHLRVELFRDLLSALEQVTTTEFSGFSTNEDSVAETVNRAVANKPTASAVYGVFQLALHR